MAKTPNEQQRQVIDELSDNILLFASAGTGKTFTIANRVANILAKGKAAANEILCLTFTIKACNELKEDIVGYVDDAGKDTQINTIHGFCYKLITEENKRMGIRSEIGICDEVDQEEILKSILSSKVYRWKAENMLQKEGITLPNLENVPVCKIKESDDFFWKVNNRLINCKGEVFPLKNAELCELELLCPSCNELHLIENKRCVGCGQELTFHFSDKKFQLYDRRTALRNFVSEIKHCREREKLYSTDEESDYQAAYESLKTEKQETYQELISYYAKYIGASPDEDFATAMDLFAGKLLVEYNEHLRLSNLMDFDDLILQANNILNTEEGLSYWKNRYKYIILDEMQDTSVLEYSVLKKIFYENNIMFCGDFFQTIYGWRGSRPLEVLEEYRKEFSARSFMLSENYRATKTLAAASFAYLQNTYPELMGKYCPTDLEIHSKQEGEKIFCYAFDNREEEAWQIYKYLLRNPPKCGTDVCIIARSNKYIAQLSEYFNQFYLERGEKDVLRFFTVEENFQFFKKSVVKDVLAVLKLLVNPVDRVSMERLTEKFVKQVGIKTIQSLRSHSRLGVSITSFIDGQTYAFGDPYHRLIEGYQTENIVVYDTETTGLNLEKDEIIQLAAIKIGAKGNIIDTLDILIEPTVPIEQAAFETHGFDLTYIQSNGGVTAKEGLERFARFVKGSVLVGHNNMAYDKPLLERELRDNALPYLNVIAEYDTLLIAKQFYPNLDNYKLATLCELFSVVNECAHNALGDITATGKCLSAMLEEVIVPTAMERQTLLSKYTPKFEKFFTFFEETRLRMERKEELATYVIDRLLLKKRYSARADYTAMRDLVESLKTDATDLKSFLKEYLKDAALAGSQMDVLIKKLNKIPIITVHQAKGCEFDTVFLAGADDNNFPSYVSKQKGDEEEEKKIFYVAITRAKRKLLLTRALYSGKHELNETPYFWAIPEEYIHANKAWKNGR